MTFGDRLKLALEKRDMSQNQLQAAMGLANSAVSRWVTGKRKKISAEHLQKMSQILRVDGEWLRTGANPQPDFTPMSDADVAFEVARKGVIAEVEKAVAIVHDRHRSGAELLTERDWYEQLSLGVRQVLRHGEDHPARWPGAEVDIEERKHPLSKRK